MSSAVNLHWAALKPAFKSSERRPTQSNSSGMPEHKASSSAYKFMEKGGQRLLYYLHWALPAVLQVFFMLHIIPLANLSWAPCSQLVQITSQPNEKALTRLI